MTTSPDTPKKGVTASELLNEVTARLQEIGEETSFEVWRQRAKMSQIFYPGDIRAASNPVTQLESWIKGVVDDEVVGSGADFLMSIIDARIEADGEVLHGESPEDTLNRRKRKIDDASHANYDVAVLPDLDVGKIRKAIAELTSEGLALYKDAPEQ